MHRDSDEKKGCILSSGFLAATEWDWQWVNKTHKRVSETETVDGWWCDKKKSEVQRGLETGDTGKYSLAQSWESMLWEGRNLCKGLFLLLRYPVFVSSLTFICSTPHLCLEVSPLRLNPAFPREREKVLHLQVSAGEGLTHCHAQWMLAQWRTRWINGWMKGEAKKECGGF